MRLASRILFAAALVFVGGCATRPVAPQACVLSQEDQEIELSRSAYAEIEKARPEVKGLEHISLIVSRTTTAT